MRRRALTLLAAISVLVGAFAIPAPAAIHEIVSSHCAGHDLPNNMAHVDPPGQIRNGQSFLRALQATGVYDVQFGKDMAGVDGQDLTEMPPDQDLEILPEPPEGTTPVTIVADNEHPATKLGEEFTWWFFVDGPFAVYLQVYELDHPAFDNCPRFHA